MVLVLVVCFEELRCERAVDRLVVRRVAPVLCVRVVGAADSRYVLSDLEAWHKIDIFYSQLVLVSPARLNVLPAQSPLVNKRLLGQAQTRSLVLVVAD